MKLYFALQYKRAYRTLKDGGIAPYLGFILIGSLFLGISNYLFFKVEQAAYLYVFITLSLVNLLGEQQKNEFLQLQFPITIYRQIRQVENMLLCTPFALFLLYQQQYLLALLTYLLSFLLAFFNKVRQPTVVIPSPFSRWPFEFTIGFRKAYPVFFLSYLLVIIAVLVTNFNLGIFGLLLNLGTCLIFYAPSEPRAYLDIYNYTPTQFLQHKLGVAFLYQTALTLPILLTLFCFFPDKYLFVLVFEVVGMLFLMVSVLGKYAYFPSTINIVASYLLALSFLLPPLLLFIIPAFYLKAKKNLETYLC